MANLEELVVSLVAETKGLRTEMEKATTATTKATTKIDKAIDEMASGTDEGVSMMATAFGTMAGFVGGAAIIGAFNLLKDTAAGLFNILVVDGVAAAQVQEDAINKLNTALALSGKFSKDASQDVQDYASSLQTITRYGDEAILGTAALIESLGNLETDGLKRATAATVDMAAALGIDLKAAAVLVGKAATGEISSFSRYGLILTKGADNAETFEKALTALEKKFGGTAAEQVKTYSGLVQQITNSFGDLTEVTGMVVTKNQVLLNIMKQTNGIINEMTGELDENSQAYKELVGQGILLFIDVLGQTLLYTDAFIKTMRTLYGVLSLSTTQFHIMYAALLTLTDGFQAGKDHMADFATSTLDNITAFSEEGGSALENIVDKLAEMRIAGAEGLEAIRAGADATIEPTNKATEEVTALSAAEAERLAGLKKMAEQLVANAENQEGVYAMELEALALHLEEKLITEETYWENREAMLQIKQDAEVAMLDKALADKQISQKDFVKASMILEKKHFIESKKLRLDREKFEARMDQLRLQGTQQFLGGLATLQNSSNKTLAAAGKAAAITKATIDAYTAISGALASMPYPANIAAAAGIGVAAFANVAKIAGVQLNNGGTVPGGSGPNRDTVPAMLTGGEEVVNRDTANKLRAFLDGNTTGGSTTKIELTLSEDLVEFVEAKIIERQNLGVSLIQTKVT